MGVFCNEFTNASFIVKLKGSKLRKGSVSYITRRPGTSGCLGEKSFKRAFSNRLLGLIYHLASEGGFCVT